IFLVAGRAAGEAARTGRLGATPAEDEPTCGGPLQPGKPVVVWPERGNVVRLHGTVSTDDLTPSSVPGVGSSSDRDPQVLRRLLLHYVDPSAATRTLAGTVLVADENF